MRVIAAAALMLLAGCAEPLRINQLQFVGSHNSYKLAMSDEHLSALRERNPDAARSLEYAHVPLEEQLDLGLRKLELDVFFDKPRKRFIVGHVQIIDMNSHCEALEDCLQTLRSWSDDHPAHVPIWISFNAKDQKIEGLPDPFPFDADALALLDRVLEANLGDRLIRPRDVENLTWPTLAAARGRFLLILDEGGTKRELYWQNWRARPMFTNAPAGHEAAAIMIINDPLTSGDEIRAKVAEGYMVRTRADADTVEARRGDTARRDAAFASGAQAVSTDYYLETNPFGTDYQVEPVLRCNPHIATADCSVSE